MTRGVGAGPSKQGGRGRAERDHKLQLSPRRHGPMFTMAGEQSPDHRARSTRFRWVRGSSGAYQFPKPRVAGSIPAGGTVSFDNQDAGITHEFHILTASPTTDPNARTLFLGKILTGPASETYHVGAASPPGTYYFQCDVHPTLMNGAFIVR